MSSGTDPPPDATSTTRNSEPFYSNEDVGILHEIVLLAQELWPKLPERERLPTNALFGAYYDILPKLGLDADHDNRYARVLFKIGGLGGPRGPDGLYQRFEAVLSKMGIEIELEEQRDETGGYEETHEDIESIAFERYERPQTRRRRNSESTVWDIVEPSRSGQRRNSFSGRHNPQTGPEPSPVQTIPPTQLYENEGIAGIMEEDDTPDRNVRAWLASRPGEPRRGRGRSVSTHGSLRIRRWSPQPALHPSPNVPTTTPSIPSNEYQSPSEITAVTSAQEQTSSSVGPLVVTRTDETATNLMHIKASLFRQQRLSGKHHFRLWREKTARLREDNNNLNIISHHYKKLFLLRRTLYNWQQCLVAGRENYETEKYYANLEQRCLIVRDWNLMRKAFSHWKELALEEVERTSIARRHILRTKTFHSWREYTVVNEFKIRRQITKKFVLVWRNRLLEASADANSALQTYNANLAKKVYVEWFWRVCDIRTISWWAGRTKERALSRWICALRSAQQSLAVAETQRNLKLLGKFQLWKAKSINALGQRQQAIKFTQDRLRLGAIKKWRKEGQVVPARITVERDISWRLLRETVAIWLYRSRQVTHARKMDHLRITRSQFKKWHHRTSEKSLQSRQDEQAAGLARLKALRKCLLVWHQKAESKMLQSQQSKEAAAFDRQRLLRDAIILWREKTTCEIFYDEQERKAVTVDRQRILREAWTNWRHKSRLQVMCSRLNERVVREAVYKWALAERICYSNQLFSRRVLQGCLEIWTQKAQVSQVERWTQEDLADDFAYKKVKSLALKRWTSQMQTLRHCEITAIRFHTPRVQKLVVSEWSGHAQHILKLQQWSGDANFYFLSSKCLKRWKACTRNSRRDKVKTAYAQIRRMSKINMARILLKTWHQKAQSISDLNSHALEMKRNKEVVFGMNIFDRWRARAEEIGEMDSLWKEKLSQKQLMSWKDRSSAFKSLEAEAIINYQERQMSQAIKKWSLLNLQQSGRLHHAVGIREKNAKKAFRKIFTYWQQRTALKRPLNRLEVEEADPLGDTFKAETWSDMGDEARVEKWAKDIDDGNPSTPIPGYLSTPSRRTERVAAAAARFWSTTPRAPLSTPFERQLRAQYSGGHLPAARGVIGRSRLGVSEGFADITTKEQE